jgi:hypothetical protein
MCVLIFFTIFSETFLSLWRTERDMIENVCQSLYKVPVNSCRIFIKLEFSRQIFEKMLKYQISWKYVQWEPSCSMRTDRRTGITKLIATFRSFVEAPKINRMYLGVLVIGEIIGYKRDGVI